MEPPPAGVAVKVTKSPAQMVVLGLAEILTEAATEETTVIVMVFEVAGDPVAQLNEEVMITVITSPFTKVDEVYVEDVAPPILLPFNCH